MENKNFTKKDLKVGYVAILANSDRSYIIAQDWNGALGLVSAAGGWMPLNEYTDSLEHKDLNGSVDEWSIVSVYGHSKFFATAYSYTPDDRLLLWTREEAKKMTVEEIEKELGYKIEIVS